MAARTISPTTYVTVCVILILLTLLTASVSFIPLAGVWHTVVGLVIGLIKASLVVLFFMHALFSDRVTRIVIAISCFWVGLLLTLTLCDYFTRGLVPFMPGH
ncbi:MAG TPA: cytochrome C oxidase subunit IV family protein [Gemmataceae bacterium]|jgi:cytochrome c oxidase subunit 4|nr:cytochrome C oxidase subunit IV family protein [Gemmataceae bacterium]